MKISILLTLSLCAVASCFGQAGSPDQAAFNRAVMSFREATDEGVARMRGSVPAIDSDTLQCPTVRDSLSQAALQNAGRIAACGAAIQVRSARFGSREWLAVVTQTGQTAPRPSKDNSNVAGFEVCLAWSQEPECNLNEVKAIATFQPNAGGKRDNLIRVRVEIDGRDPALMGEAKKLKPGDWVLFNTSSDVSDEHIRIARWRQFAEGHELQAALLCAASLGNRDPGELPYPVIELNYGGDEIGLHLRLESDDVLHGYQWISGPSLGRVSRFSLHASAFRVIDESEAEKRTANAYALAKTAQTFVYEKDVKAHAPKESMELDWWLEGLKDSPTRLLEEAVARVFEADEKRGDAKAASDIAKSILTGDAKHLRDKAVWVLALAELRGGNPRKALKVLEEWKDLKGTPRNVRMRQLVGCLARSRTGEDVGTELLIIRESMDANTDSVPDYLPVALLAEIRSAVVNAADTRGVKK